MPYLAISLASALFGGMAGLSDTGVSLELCRSASDQRIIGTVVEVTDAFAAKSLFVDFEIGAKQKVRRKLLDRILDCFRSGSKSQVLQVLRLGPLAHGREQFPSGAVIECGHSFGVLQLRGHAPYEPGPQNCGPDRHDCRALDLATLQEGIDVAPGLALFETVFLDDLSD
jgi:hypothetical protein